MTFIIGGTALGFYMWFGIWYLVDDIKKRKEEKMKKNRDSEKGPPAT